MPFDPTKPGNGAPVAATEIGATSANRNGVGTLGMAVSDPPTQAEVQAIPDKLHERINALRR